MHWNVCCIIAGKHRPLLVAPLQDQFEFGLMLLEKDLFT